MSELVTAEWIEARGRAANVVNGLLISLAMDGVIVVRVKADNQEYIACVNALADLIVAERPSNEPKPKDGEDAGGQKGGVSDLPGREEGVAVEVRRDERGADGRQRRRVYLGEQSRGGYPDLREPRASGGRHPGVDRRRWAPGPWDDEPDAKAWTDAATGLYCLAWRETSGEWWGFVETLRSSRAPDLAVNQVFEVHGQVQGRLYDAAPFIPAKCVVAFSCGSLPEDLKPAETYEERKARHGYPFGDGRVYRSLGYCCEECTRLARQVADHESGRGKEGRE